MEKKHTLVEIITLLKYKACKNWGSDEALEILLVIASLRECLLQHADLTMRSNTLDGTSLVKALTNVNVQLGKVLRDLDLICEKYELSNPVKNLEGEESLTEILKLAKIDKEFYATKDAFVVTEEIYEKKKAELGTEFYNENSVYPLANIKLYDTIILLMIGTDYDDKFIEKQIESGVMELRQIVAERNSIIPQFDKNKHLGKIEDLARKLGSIQSIFDSIAYDFEVPNALNNDYETHEIWEILSNMFEVLELLPAEPKTNKNAKSNNNNNKKQEVKEEKNVNTDGKY